MSTKTPRGTAESAEQAGGGRPAVLDHELIDWAWAQPIMNNPGARIVLMCMARRVDDTWECTASQEEVAMDAMMSSRSVRRHMEQLEAGGFIQRRKQYGEKGHRLPDRCRLNPGAEPSDRLPSDQIDYRTDRPVANLACGSDQRESLTDNLASGQDGLWADWPVGDPSETDIPSSDPAAKLTSGQIGRASSSPTENYQKKTSSSPSKPKQPDDAPPREDIEQICARLFRWLIKKNYRQRPDSVPDGWREAARKLFDLDKIPLQEALDVLDWSQRDHFWHQNIHSLVKFRAKYGDLEMKSRGQRGGSQGDGQNNQSRPAGTGGHIPNGSGSQVPPRGQRQNPFRSKRESA